MKDAILEGGNQFEKVHGMSIFQYMDKDPAFNIVFNKGMTDLSTIALGKFLRYTKDLWSYHHWLMLAAELGDA